MAAALQVAFAIQNGGATALLHIGAESELRGSIEDELGDIRLWPEQGHDGKFSYAIARQPFELDGAGVDHPAYRYRRYLYSLLGGGFGFFPPMLTLYGLMALAAVGFGLGAVGAAALARTLRAGQWSPIAGLVNVGALSGVLQLTSDPLAFGLSMAGAALWVRQRQIPGLALLLLAVWSKEVYLLVPLGIGLWEFWERRVSRGVVVAGAPICLAAAWGLALAAVFPETSMTNSAFTAPFSGIWSALGLAESGFSIGSQLTTLAVLLVGSVAPVVARQRLLLSLTGVWVGLALVSHEQVWHQDSMRAFAPLFTFAVIAVAILSRQRGPHLGGEVTTRGPGA